MVGILTIGNLIGKGSFGKVYDCQHVKHKGEFVVKVVDNPNTIYEKQNLSMEISAISKLGKRKGFVDLIDVIDDNKYTYIVMEKAKGGTLSKNDIPKSRSKKYGLIRSMAECLQACEEEGVVHMDTKPNNFIYDPYTNQVTLIDFGLSICYDPTDIHKNENIVYRLPGPRGSKYFIPPEIMLANTVYRNSDVWSHGILAHLILTNRLLSTKSNTNKGYMNILTTISKSNMLSMAEKSYLMKCIALTPDNRANTDLLLSRPSIAETHYVSLQDII